MSSSEFRGSKHQGSIFVNNKESDPKFLKINNHAKSQTKSKLSDLTTIKRPQNFDKNFSMTQFQNNPSYYDNEEEEDNFKQIDSSALLNFTNTNSMSEVLSDAFMLRMIL